MCKNILLSVETFNGSEIHFGTGSWLSTKWNIYTDGTYEKTEKFDELCIGFENFQPKPKRCLTSEGTIHEEDFSRLKLCLSNHIHFSEAYLGCDTDGLEITIFAPNGQIRDRYCGSVDFNKDDILLTTISEILSLQY